MRKKSLLACSFLPFYLNAAAPQAYEPNSYNVADVLWNNATHELSTSIFYQQAFGDDLTFLDATFLGYYATGRFYGVKGAVGMMLSAPILEFNNGTHETFQDVKQIFLLNTIYADYYNNQLGIHAIAGRYKAQSEWNTYYSQGFQVKYSGLPYTSLDFMASYGSALVTNEFVTPFRSDLSKFGTYFLSADFTLPKYAKLSPYVYITEYFTAFGMKTNVSYYVARDLKMETGVHIVGYGKYYSNILPPNGNHKFELAVHAGLANQSMAGVAWVEQKLEYLDMIEAKVGILGVTTSGTELLDYYGHSLPFKYTVGMFWGGAVTTYASIGYHWHDFLEIKAGVRGSFLPTGNVTSFEIKGETEFPIWRQKNRYGQVKTYVKGRVGVSFVGVYNNTPAVNFYGGNNYTLLRGFFRISI